MSVLSSRRYLSVWLRRLSTDRIERRSSERVETFVVVASIKGAQRITALTDGAARLGLKIGIGLADARARYPKLPIVEADPEADGRLLDDIAQVSDQIGFDRVRETAQQHGALRHRFVRGTHIGNACK